MDIIYFLIVGLIAGAIASYVMGRQQDLLVNLLIASWAGFSPAFSGSRPMDYSARSLSPLSALFCASGCGYA